MNGIATSEIPTIQAYQCAKCKKLFDPKNHTYTTFAGAVKQISGVSGFPTSVITKQSTEVYCSIACLVNEIEDSAE